MEVKSKEVGKYLFEFSEYLDKRISETCQTRFGYESLDKIVGGLYRGKVYVVGARTGKGKTAFLTNIALNNSLSSKVLLFSTEISMDEFVERVLSLLTNIPVFDFRTKIADLYDDLVLNHLNKLEKYKLFVNDSPSPKISVIFDEISQIYPDLVIIDYLGQLFFDKTDNVPRAVTNMMNSLKFISRKFNTPILIASQLNRSVEYRSGKPILSDLKDSGGIEECADVVIFIDELNDSDIGFSVAKSRYSGTGTIKLSFDRSTLRIGNLGESEWD